MVPCRSLVPALVVAAALGAPLLERGAPAPGHRLMTLIYDAPVEELPLIPPPEAAMAPVFIDFDPAIAAAFTPPDVAMAPVFADIDPISVASIPPQRAAAPAAVVAVDAAATFTRVDTSQVKPALALYARGDLAGGDALAREIRDPVARAGVDYAGLRLHARSVGYERIMGFLLRYPNWPSEPWLLKRAEEALFGDRRNGVLVKAHFAARPPLTPAGRLALARLCLEQGEGAQAKALVAEVWRNGDFNADFERGILREFSAQLSPADHKFRADRMLYKENVGAGLRLAALAGGDVVKLAQARAAVVNEAAPDAAFAAVPAALKADPGLTFSRIQHLRRAERLDEAARLMIAAPRDAAAIVDGDEWWTERRLVSRELLDKGDAASAYQVAAGHGAQCGVNIIEAEFHAGWIALRFLDDAASAARHFARAAERAETPMSISRAAYWQGRAAEAAGLPQDAHTHYERAAAQSIAYYGQLAREKLGMPDFALRKPEKVARGDGRALAVRVIDMLYGLDARELAVPLALEAAQNLASDAQVAAVAEIAAAAKDARVTLMIGKAATQRGMMLDHAAFPDFGVPAYEALANSGSRAMVYAIARQESAFQPQAVSGAGAKGLMQMLVSTARRTASRARVAFDAGRLTSDPAFNAQLGAAHLGELMGEHKGSLILTFAAYNAGGGRVKEWIDAHGDPRKPGVDPIDWVERIPITETRNYVQRIMENLQVYRLRFGEGTKLAIASDMALGR